jgi:CSLREA domain-containing protein
MRTLTCLLVFVTWIEFAPAAAAATFTVNTTADEVDVTPGDGVCLTANGVCSLRAAIQEANAFFGNDTIIVPPGTYTLTIPQVIPGPDYVDPADGDLDITERLEILGAGAGTTIIQAGVTPAAAVGRVFDVMLSADLPVTIEDVTIRFGRAFAPGVFTACAGGGGAVANRRHPTNHAAGVTLARTVITGNAANQGSGGALCNESPGMVAIVDTTVRGNQATHLGGGLMNNGGALFSLASTLTGNSTSDTGGAIAAFGGYGEVVNSTISGNLAARGAGLAIMDGSLNLRNTTVTDNTATANSGGAIHAGTGALAIRHTIIAGNQAPTYPDCLNLTSLAYNVIGIGIDWALDPCLPAPDPSDQIGTDVVPLDPLLGPLSYNGGPTQTHALLFGSPAIDAGDPALGCREAFNTPIPDQRGLPRPLAQCDVGAYEAQQVFGGANATVFVQGVGNVTFGTSAGVFGSLDPVSVADLPEEGKPNVAFPFGLFSWTVTGLAQGQMITVTITYPQIVPASFQYWKVIDNVWMNATAFLGSHDGVDNVLTLTITDGQFPDADGVANGQISDPGGVSPSKRPRGELVKQ